MVNLIELKLERIRQGKTQADVAAGTSMTPTMYGQKERGETDISVDEACEVATSLELSDEKVLFIFFNRGLPNGNELR